MAWRKWVVRGLVFTVASAIAAGGIVYQHWTDPAEVRRQVLAQFASRFPGANITVESARLRLLGGIAVSDLRMTRRDDADMINFLHVPFAIIYHDKEQLLGGKMAIRKLELERARLRILRDSDGHWNLAGLLASPDARERIPTILVKQGTILIEDRRAHGATPLEIKDVSLKIINDPDATVTFEGSGLSDALGPVQLSGTWQRDSGQTTLTCDAPSIPIVPALVQRFAGVCAEVVEHAHDFSGSGNLHLILDYHPDAPHPWEHDVTFTLTSGKFNHKQLPMPLEGITGSLHCVNGHIDKVEARAQAGTASVHLTLDDVTLPFGCNSPDCWCTPEMFKKLNLTIDNLPITPTLFEYFPEKYRSLKQKFSPSGAMNVNYLLWYDAKGLLCSRMTLLPQRMGANFKEFPYPVRRITGKITHNSVPGEPDRLDVDLVGYASDQPVFVRAKLTGTSPDSTIAVDVRGENIPIDEWLLGGLRDRPKYQALARSFQPTGLVNFQVHSEWKKDAAPGHEGGHFDNHYLITFHDATAAWKVFPYPLEDVEGVLDIRPDHWEFRHFKGRHGNGTFYTAGRSQLEADGKEHVEVAIAGRDVQLDDDLKKALHEDLKRVWATFDPAGPIEFDGTIRIVPDQGEKAVPDISLTVKPLGCRVTPQFFGYTLNDLKGIIRYEKGTVELVNVAASHGLTKVELDHGIVQLSPEGGFRADLVYLHADPLVTDADFLAALQRTPALQKAIGALAVDGGLSVQTRLYIDKAGGTEQPRIYWDGSAVLRDATLHTGVKLEHVTGAVALRGWHNGQHIESAAGNLDVRNLTLFNQPITELKGQILISEDEPEVLKFPGLLARYFGGQIYGPLRLEFGSKLRYRLDLAASQVELEQFGKRNFNNTDLSGRAVAQIYLEGEGGELSGLKGNGRIDVPNGKMYNLPLLLDLLKFLGLRLPDRTAFEEAHVVFDIEGLRAHVKQLELYGNAISLRGSGDANIDGSDLAFVFYLDWARLGQVLPAGVREVPREISNQLFRIDMRGKVGDLHFREEPVPLILSPLRKMFAGDDDWRWNDAPAKR
jgi:hypothetical protein